MINEMIKKAIIRSQHCQRNWDLSREIPQEDIEVIETAVTSCPSKQNITFYKPYFITDRAKIEAIHANSMGAYTRDKVTGEGKYNTNSQLLAHLLVVLVGDYDSTQFDRNPHIKAYFDREMLDSEVSAEMSFGHKTHDSMIEAALRNFERDKNTAVGIAAGYMNLTASMLGYSTGCCQCVYDDAVREILGIDGEILLIMGIGYNDPNRPRREHHLEPNSIFLSHSKKIVTETV